MTPKTLIIAEAGVNHNGSVAMARQLIDVAAISGANAVKFQTFNSKKLVTEYAPKANYQKINSTENESQLNMLQSLELSAKDHFELFDYANSKKIDFLDSL
jgi:sialic acid synthase SpsE